MSSSGPVLLSHEYTRPFEELYTLSRIETITFDDGIEYVIGTPFSEITYYLENEYKYTIIKDLRDVLKRDLKEELKRELKEELKRELKEENNRV